MMGGLAASYVNVSTPLVLNTGNVNLSVQADVLDKIVPGLLPLLTVTGVYILIDKIKRNYSLAVLIILASGLILGGLGIL